MFSPSLSDVRNFFFDCYIKGQNNQVLTDLEKIAFSLMLEHPEYQPVFSNREKYADYNWSPEAGITNPFLHLSMHLSIYEQLSINQPVGVKELYHELCSKTGVEHDAQHLLMDCLAEMIWQSQYTAKQPDPAIYLNCLRAKLGRE